MWKSVSERMYSSSTQTTNLPPPRYEIKKKNLTSGSYSLVISLSQNTKHLSKRYLLKLILLFIYSLPQATHKIIKNQPFTSFTQTNKQTNKQKHIKKSLWLMVSHQKCLGHPKVYITCLHGTTSKNKSHTSIKLSCFKSELHFLNWMNCVDSNKLRKHQDSSSNTWEISCNFQECYVI